MPQQNRIIDAYLMSAHKPPAGLIPQAQTAPIPPRYQQAVPNILNAVSPQTFSELQDPSLFNRLGTVGNAALSAVGIEPFGPQNPNEYETMRFGFPVSGNPKEVVSGQLVATVPKAVKEAYTLTGRPEYETVAPKSAMMPDLPGHWKALFRNLMTKKSLVHPVGSMDVPLGLKTFFKAHTEKQPVPDYLQELNARIPDRPLESTDALLNFAHEIWFGPNSLKKSLMDQSFESDEAFAFRKAAEELSEQSGPISSAARDFIENGYPKNMVGTGTTMGYTRANLEHAAVLMNNIHNGPRISKPIYRTELIYENPSKFMADVKPGAVIQIGPTSHSLSRHFALSWNTMTEPVSENVATKILYRVKPNAKGILIAPYSPHAEAEVVSGGMFMVDGVSKGHYGEIIVDLTQKDTFEFPTHLIKSMKAADKKAAAAYLKKHDTPPVAEEPIVFSDTYLEFNEALKKAATSKGSPAFEEPLMLPEKPSSDAFIDFLKDLKKSYEKLPDMPPRPTP